MEHTPAEIREARNAFFLMDYEYLKVLAVHGSDKEIEAAKWGIKWHSK